MKVLFQTPPDLRFSCSRCGDCCRDSNILLEPSEATAIAALAWPADEPERERYLDPAVEVPGPSGQKALRLRRLEDGACIFLDDQGCKIHSRFGGEAKPRMCQLYPFSFFPRDETVDVDCAFSCRSIRERSGEPVATLDEEWRLLLSGRTGADLAAGLDELRLSDRYRLSDRVLSQLERHLVGFLEHPQLSLFDAVRCMSEFPRLAVMGDPETESAETLRTAMAQGLPRQIEKMSWRGHMDKTQNAIFFQWLYLALNPARVDQDLLTGKELAEEQRNRVEQGDAYRDSQARPFVDNREIGASFGQISQVDATALDGLGAAQRPLAAEVVGFLRAKIIGKRYLAAGTRFMPFVEAIPKFLLLYPMVLWTSKAMAADRGAGEVERCDVRQALRLLDRSFGQLDTRGFARKQARACDFVMLETDVVLRARNQVLGVAEVEEKVSKQALLDGL